MKRLLSVLLLIPILVFGQVTTNNSITGVAASQSNVAITGGTITGLSAPIPVPSGGTGGNSLTGLVLGNGASAYSAYAGTSCTNQFARSLAASGSATCAAVSLTADVAGIAPTANGGTGIAYFTAAGPTAARVYTFPDAAATIARTDAAQTFTGAQTYTGQMLQADGTTSAPSYSFTSSTGTGTANSSGTLLLAASANIVEQRSGANAQTLRAYNTFTDASNYERGVFDWVTNANALTIGTASAGTGSGRELVFEVANLNIIRIGTTSFRPTSNGSIDLGTNTLGWKRFYVDYTNTGTVGAVTINKAAGRVNLAAAGTSLVVTDNLATAASHIFLNADSAPGNVVAVQLYAVPAAGSFTITAVPAVTNQTAIDFFIVNAD